MKRQKVKWRFQNIVSTALFCLVLKQAYAKPSTEPALQGESHERADAKQPYEGAPLQLSAKPNSGTGAPEDRLPVIQGTLRDFTMPRESRFWELHGLRFDATLRRSIERLSEHLVGNSKERSSVFQFCDSRSKTKKAETEQGLSSDRISCLYYEWQQLARAARNEKAKNAPQKSVSKAKKSKKTKKASASATHELRSLRDMQKLRGHNYRDLLKKIDFRDEASALSSARVALQEPSDCSLTSVRAAVLRDMENYLPSNSVWAAMNDLYAALAPCLRPENEAFEVVNSRLALMHLDRRNSTALLRCLRSHYKEKILKMNTRHCFGEAFLIISSFRQVRKLPLSLQNSSEFRAKVHVISTGKS